MYLRTGNPMPINLFCTAPWSSFGTMDLASVPKTSFSSLVKSLSISSITASFVKSKIISDFGVYGSVDLIISGVGQEKSDYFDITLLTCPFEVEHLSLLEINTFPHTTTLQQTTLKSSWQKYGKMSL